MNRTAILVIVLLSLLLLAGCAGSGFEPGFMNNNPGAAEGARMIFQAWQQPVQQPQPYQYRQGTVIPMGGGYYNYYEYGY